MQGLRLAPMARADAEILELLSRLKVANPHRYAEVLDLLRAIVPMEEQLASHSPPVRAIARRAQRMRGK